jgi:hypothetical protein
MSALLKPKPVEGEPPANTHTYRSEPITRETDFSEPAGTWTEEAKAAGRRKGADTVAENRDHRHAIWADQVVKMLLDAYIFSRTWPTRKTIIDGIRDFNLTYRIKGKGGQVKRSTVSRWLTEDVEIELRVKAIDDLISAERVKHQG